MDPRIDKLLRQRNLLREHLNWIEEEIVAARSDAAPLMHECRTESSATDSVNPTTEPAPAPAPAVDSIADAVVPEPDTRNVQSEVRAGCMFYFGIATAALGLLIAYIYWRY